MTLFSSNVGWEDTSRAARAEHGLNVENSKENELKLATNQEKCIVHSQS